MVSDVHLSHHALLPAALRLAGPHAPCTDMDAIVSPHGEPCNTTNIIRLAHLHGYLTLIAFDHVRVLSRH
jgi:hypothetical protein